MAKISDTLKNLMKTAGSANYDVAMPAQAEIAKAMELPLQQGIFDGDILAPYGVYEVIQLDPGAPREWPLHFVQPGTESEYTAYTIPNHGYIPQRHVEGDYIMIPGYDVGNSIDTNLKYLRHANWPVQAAMQEALMAGFTKKLNDDGWHVILAAGVDRNIVVRDSDKAAAGQFTKRVVNLAQQVMRRNGGGNSTSINRGKLTDLFLSPEAVGDIKNWNVDQIDDVTRREIFLRKDGGLSEIFGVVLHDLDELGEGQEYQLYLENELSVTLPGSDVEVAIGLDLGRANSFLMFMASEGIGVFPDPVLHRQRRWGVYSWLQDIGFSCLDTRSVILLSI